MFDILKKLSWFFKLRWKSYLMGIIALGLCALFSAATPFLLGRVIDGIAQGSLSLRDLIFNTGLIMGLALVMYGLRYVWRSTIFGNSTLLESIMRNRLFDYFTKMDAIFFNNYRTGDLMAHATNDLAALRFVAGGGILTLVDSIFVGSINLLSMFFIVDWKLTLYTLLPFPLLILVSRFLGQSIMRRFRGALEAFSKMNDQVQESVSGMKVIKSFGEEADDYQDFSQATGHVVEKNRRVYQVEAAYLPVIEIITGLTYVLALFFGSYFVSINRISIGDLIAFFSYLAMMAWPLLAVGRLVNILERGNASYDRIVDLLSHQSHIEEVENPIENPQWGDISFDIESFSYPGEDQPTLRELAFHLEEGQTLGLVGRTGSGKSTIFKLLTRDYDHYEGQIRYGGENIKAYRKDDLLEAIGYVPQDNFLFVDTIRENIRFARPDLDQEGVEYYAKLAHIHEDIIRLPQGYDTMVGERGVSLSGGQRQRVAIARALAKNPDFLILDDALSAVDAQTEEKILKSLRDHPGARTRIIASHRLSAVMEAQEILVLDQGRVLERGTHQELLAQGGWYREMFDQQELQQNLEEGGEDHEG
ncbi:MAG: ABC transporter transmembrane domain-containing protein [Tissierellia bacterium]|nr:ABC transporter transmembrane domain-containing protein [Tissierellia bacterium]